MNIGQLGHAIQQLVSERFPLYPCRIGRLPEDSECITVGVFCVPNEMVVGVRDFIHDLDETLGVDHGACIIPLVRDLSVTRRYYPNFCVPDTDLILTSVFKSIWDSIDTHSLDVDCLVPDRLTREWAVGNQAFSLDPKAFNLRINNLEVALSNSTQSVASEELALAA